MKNDNLEREYTFQINKKHTELNLPSELGRFRLISKKNIRFKDYILDTKNQSLNDQKIGLRLRIYKKKGDLTLKKFLGRTKDIATYKEHTLKIPFLYLQSFEKSGQDYIKNILKMKGIIDIRERLTILLEINNDRQIYTYKTKNITLELVVETLKYLKNGRAVEDALLEIEIIQINETNESLKLVSKFVDSVKDMFKCLPINEGKTSRAIRLLETTQ